MVLFAEMLLGMPSIAKNNLILGGRECDADASIQGRSIPASLFE